MLGTFDATIPPFIAESAYPGTPDMNTMAAAVAIARLDDSAGDTLRPLAELLTRTEASSSSKIEAIRASIDDYARAVGGSRANPSATSLVAATAALRALVDEAGASGRIHLDAVLDAHRVLMRDDPLDGRYAGVIRPMQNWLEGSDHSPRGARHVPPAPGRVRDLMDDLILYAGRDDVDPITQAAIAHAQFESIHPFTDGNGRIGRALISAVLRRRGVANNVIVPIASAMAADRPLYFRLLEQYRDGHAYPFVRHLALSALVAAEESRESADRLRRIPEIWATRITARAGSTAHDLARLLLERPIITADDVPHLLGVSTSSAFAAIDRLVADDVLHEVTGRKRGRVYAAGLVLDEVGDLESRIATRMRRELDSRLRRDEEEGEWLPGLDSNQEPIG